MNLLQMNFSGAVLIVTITVIRAAAVNRLPKKIFLGLWGVVLLRLAIPVSVPSAFSIYSVLENNLPDNTAAVWQDAAMPAITQQLNLTESGQQMSAHALPISIWLIIWGIGVILCSTAFALCYWRCWTEFRVSLPVREPYAQQWLESRHLRRKIEIRQSDKISAPLTYGIFRPVILMPARTDWKNTKLMNYVLLHEYVHICHWDTMIKLAFTCILCLYWYNPFVWLMYILLNRDIELACDESVVHRLGENSKSTYARMLICMEAKQSGLGPLYNSFSKNAIEERITAIMKTRKTSIATILIGIVLTAAVTAGCATSAQNIQAKQQPSQPGVQLQKDKGSIAAGIDVPDTVKQAAEALAIQKMEKGQYQNWRIGALAHVYTYEKLEGKTLEVYQMDYECMQNPEKSSAENTDADKDGWIRPEYANSNFLVFMKQGDKLSYIANLTENDCFPGDAIFTSDLKTALKK